MTRPHEQILCYMHLPATPSALGELTLGTRADLVTRTRWAAGLGWWAYVPLLADANEMSGGGELGVGFASHLDAQWQDTTLTVFIGLDIRGDPLRPFGQDDIPLSWLQVKHPIGQNLLHVRGGGGWRTARNPARQQLTAGLQRPLARTWWVGAEGTIGLSPAAVDHGGRLWFSWRQAEG